MLFQFSFLRISFCEDGIKIKAGTVLQFKLSILFFEDFFLRGITGFHWRHALWGRSSFNPLFWGFLFASAESGDVSGATKSLLLFQSSFLRISFCERVVRGTCKCDFENYESFNPLFWGFLFASCIGLFFTNPKKTFQSSFLRISFCELIGQGRLR